MMEKWQKLKEEEFEFGYRKYVQKTFKLPNGVIAPFEIKKEQSAVAVVAITPDQKVVLARQYRPGTEEILLEMPGGVVEDGEDPAEAIKRELLEETGYTGDFQSAGTNIDCAYSTKVRYNFVATNCQRVSDPKPDEREFIEVVLMPLKEFREFLKTGQTTDVENGYIGLDYLGLL